MMTDKDIMSIEKAMFILRHGSAEGEHKYFESVDVIEKEYNRQQAEIERLQTERDFYKAPSSLLAKGIEKIKSEAVKEFANLIKRRLNSNTSRGAYLIDIIDNLVKEMTEQ